MVRHDSLTQKTSFMLSAQLLIGQIQQSVDMIGGESSS